MAGRRQNLSPLKGAPKATRLGSTGRGAVCIALILGSFGLIGCGDEPPQPKIDVATPQDPGKTWPEGAVLAAGDVPILQAEVDRAASWVQLLYPENTQPSLRRKALTHFLLIRAALASAFPDQRAEALAAAESALQDLDKPGAPAPRVLAGAWSDLGLELWGEVRDLEPGRYHGPIELSGRWALVRKDSATPGLVPAADLFTVSLFEFLFVPASFEPGTLTAAQSKLTILDPAWEAIVPSAWGKSLPDGWYAGPK